MATLRQKVSHHNFHIVFFLSTLCVVFSLFLYTMLVLMRNVVLRIATLELLTPHHKTGGDILWLNKNTIAVGRGYRTNDEGIRQLQEALHPIGMNFCPSSFCKIYV